MPDVVMREYREHVCIDQCQQRRNVFSPPQARLVHDYPYSPVVLKIPQGIDCSIIFSAVVRIDSNDDGEVLMGLLQYGRNGFPYEGGRTIGRNAYSDCRLPAGGHGSSSKWLCSRGSARSRSEADGR